MAHVARINAENIVTYVMVVDNKHDTTPVSFAGVEDWAAQFAAQVPGLAEAAAWRQTSYNANFRKNFAGIGYTYDPIRDAFIAPKPTDDAVLDEDTCRWNIPQKEIES